MIKAIFLDIDGTLVSFNTHRIPESTMEALAEARRRGVKVFIATGRPRPFVDNLGELEYDGMVTMNGASVVLGKGDRVEEIACHLIGKDDIERMVEYQREHNMAVAYASNNEAFVSLPDAHFEEIFHLLDLKTPTIRQPEYALEMKGIGQVIAFFDEEQERYICEHVLKGCSPVRWHPLFADCIRKGIDKAVGIDDVCRYYGFDVADCMAFGDGGNDIGMLRHVGTGVAMGNARDDVKGVADYVTTSVDEDGIMNALRHFRVI